jgi:hypothetical protein
LAMEICCLASVTVAANRLMSGPKPTLARAAIN